MINKEILLGIEKILDNWDPIGVLQNVKPIGYETRAFGEYSKYIHPLLNTYLSNASIYDFLIKLQSDLMDEPNEEIEEEIRSVSRQIMDYLSKYRLTEIEKCHE